MPLCSQNWSIGCARVLGNKSAPRKHSWREGRFIAPFSQQLGHWEVTWQVRFKPLRGFKPTRLTLSSYHAVQISGRDLAPSTLLFNLAWEIHHGERGKDLVAEKHNVLSWEGGHLQSSPHSGHCCLENTPTEQGSKLPPCTIIHSYAMQVALSAVSFGRNSSYIIREDSLCWKG